jgi:AcrR family transcriptional regulator
MGSREVGTRPAGTRRERGSISAEEIIAGALRLAREVTVAGLSMPKVAQELGIGVTSIYWYFRNKDDLLDALTSEASAVLHSQLSGLDGPDWAEHLRAYFHQFRAVLCNDDVLCDLILMRSAGFRADTLAFMWPQMESMLEALVAAGFTEREAVDHYFALSLYTRGGVLLERQSRKAGMPPQIPVRLPAAFDVTPFPLLARAAQWHSFRGVTDNEFTASLDAMIEGMRAQLANRTTSAP